MERTRVPSTRTSLIPPAGFVAAERFPGFEDPVREASIAVTELPIPLASVEADLTEDRLQATGLTVLTAGRRSAGGWQVQVRADEWSGAVWKWIAALGDDQHSALVVATAPAGDEALADQISAALASCTFDPVAPTSPFEGLPFQVDELGGLRVAARTTHLALLTEGGEIGKAPGEPMLTVGAIDAPDPAEELATFARDRLRDLAQVHGVQELSSDGLVLASGLVAHELLAEGLLGPDAVPVRVYQLVAEAAPRRLVVVGVVHQVRADAQDAFRDIGRSLRRGVGDS